MGLTSEMFYKANDLLKYLLIFRNFGQNNNQWVWDLKYKFYKDLEYIGIFWQFVFSKSL